MNIPTPIVFDAPVVAVTLLEDRAQVRRRGSVNLPAGESTLVVEGIAPVLLDKTIQARISPGRVNNATISRKELILDEDRPQPFRKIMEEVEALEARQQEFKKVRASLATCRERLGELATLAVSEISEDASWGRISQESWNQGLDALGAAEGRAADTLNSLTIDHQRNEKQISDLESRLIAMKNPSISRVASLRLDVRLEEPATVALEIDYIVPGACWRPAHTAELDGTTISFTSEACVWQNTGEPWEDVELTFSTERASLGVEPPKLQSDVLSVEPKLEVIKIETREKGIHTTGLGHAAETDAATPELPGIDDGGEPNRLRAPSRTSVSSDGRPHRFPVFSFETTAETALVTMPELVQAVILKSVQSNESAYPILAGPVDLVRHGGLVGRTTVLFVAPKERFALGWGPDPELRVRRTHERLNLETKMLSSWNIVSYRTEIRLSNLSHSPQRVEVTERVPVSEINKVMIEVDGKRTRDGVQPDHNGILTWTLELSPRGRDTLELAYTIKWHQSVEGSLPDLA